MNPHTDGLSQLDEQELIAFHLGEPCDERRIRARLESEPDFAALSESIAHTLRVFSGEPIPTSDPNRAWQNLRSTLPVLEPAARPRRWLWTLLVPAAIAVALLFAAGLALLHHRSTTRVDDAGVIHLRAPLQPVGEQGMNRHLDRAERWLTAVNHSSEPLDPATRAEGEQLLTRNALYLQDARGRGDLPDAAVLERLDRVLTTANHPTESGLQMRVEMNTDGLLFELRVLRQNQNENTSTGDTR